jgi:polysaccharide export outer membrane protein
MLGRVRALLLTLVALAGCGTTSYDYSKEPDLRKKEFVIGVADGVRITVWKNPELSTDASVRPDGTITMPLLGDIQAVGKTPSQLKEEVGQRLQQYIKDENAVVTVAITGINSYRFTVSGNFEHPGIMTSKYYVTVADAIAMAGGLNKFANPKKIVIVRPDPKTKVRRIPIDYDRVSSGEHPEENLVLMAGDTLYAP